MGKADVYWIRQYIGWTGLRHSREMGEAEVVVFCYDKVVTKKLSRYPKRQAVLELVARILSCVPV